jgi:microcystin-dependent protein
LALVGRNPDEASAPYWTKDFGLSYGDYEHRLTVNEIPAHNHGQRTDSDGGADQPQVTNISGSIDGLRGQTDPATSGKTQLMTDLAGSNQPHNNVQPSIVIGVWKRTA